MVELLDHKPARANFSKITKDRVFGPIFKCCAIGSHNVIVMTSLLEPVVKDLKVG